jgi:hypothetical protein
MNPNGLYLDGIKQRSLIVDDFEIIENDEFELVLKNKVDCNISFEDIDKIDVIKKDDFDFDGKDEFIVINKSFFDDINKIDVIKKDDFAGRDEFIVIDKSFFDNIKENIK